MILVEFCGAPGTGKSTVAGRLVEELRKENISVLTRNDILSEESGSAGKLRDLLMSIIKHPALSLYTYSTCLEYGAKVSNFRYASRLLKLVFLLEKAMAKNEYRICVLDEGIVQYITSIPHDKTIKDTGAVRKLIHKLQLLFSETRFVFCDLDKETIYNRLINRESSGARIAALSPEQKKKLIDVRVKNMDYIRTGLNGSRVYTVDMSQSSDRIDLELWDICMCERKF